jgi:hypothetical protein
MGQLTIRLGDDLAGQVKAHADELGRSVNGWIVAVLQAAIDPDLADSDVERTRGRLARAGLLVAPTRLRSVSRPDAKRVTAARRAAGKGRMLSDVVSDERG